MITIRQIERAWTGRTYEKLFRDLAMARPESTLLFDHGPARCTPTAAMGVIRLDELSQSHAPICAKLLRAVIASQESDGGWGDVMTTALCARALLCSKGDGAAIERGLRYLANLQKSEGIWPAVPLRRMPADAFVSAFVLYELGDSPRFRACPEPVEGTAVDFGAAVAWFARNESTLDPKSRTMWERARHRCRLHVAPKRQSEMVFAFS